MLKMNVLVASVLSFAALSANAASYKCHVAGNPERFMNIVLDVELTNTQVGGEIFFESEGKKAKAGTITEVVSLNANNPKEKPAFDLVLGYVAAPDVSGVSAETLKKITSITSYKDAKSEGELTILRLFVQDKQVGGSILADGSGTSCL